MALRNHGDGSRMDAPSRGLEDLGDAHSGNPAHEGDGFAGELLSPAQAAATLGFDVKTLRRHVALGNIAFIDVGLGRVRPRRRFARCHVAAFIAERRVRFTPPAADGVDLAAVRRAVRRKMAALDRTAEQRRS